MASGNAPNSDQNGLVLVNRLHQSRSPYVRSHMNNPVAWQVWGPEALELAKKHNRLLFLSIGYAACHWCHVMERESFSSPEIAHILNTSFIPIKIDREERPDVDAIYMNYVQATTGSGGWPLNVFVTPDLEPVFGGTYWPGPNDSMAGSGTALADTVGFMEILEKMRAVWTQQEGRCRESAKEITKQLREFAEEGVHSHHVGEKTDGEGLELELLEEAYQHFARKYDKINGGFSAPPKFPIPANLSFLLKLSHWPEAVKHIVGEAECEKATDMVVYTLKKIARGGIRDQVGYGFARYSVTRDWSLPHFEKMLYDQGQLLDVYLDAFLTTRDPELLGVVQDIATYLTTSPIAAPKGGFYSAEDADSYPTKTDTEKREGAFYVWTLKTFLAVLGERDGDICARYYGVSADGNVKKENDPHDEFISQNVLRITSTPSSLAKQLGLAEEEVTRILADGRRKLREYRERERPRPALDDKIVVAWNGLAIGALARTGAALEAIDPVKAKECISAAEKAVEFIQKELFDADTAVLWRIYREGRGDAPGFCDDYAFLIQGLIDLYEATFKDKYLKFADILQKSQLSLFLSHPPPSSPSTQTPTTTTTITTPPSLGFFNHPSPPPPSLLLRLKTGMDSTEPSPNNISASNLYRLSSLLDDSHYATIARETVQAFEAEVEQFPWCFVGLLGGVVWNRCGGKAIMVVEGGGGGGGGGCGVGSSGSGSGGDEDEKKGKLQERVLRKLRDKVNVSRTIIAVGRDDGRWGGEWLRGRNELVGNLDLKNGGVWVCEKGACKVVGGGGGGGGLEDL